jgi:hypothetical protein
MAFVKTWDETVPADTESVGAGAGRIRDEKEAVRERLAIDHNFKATEGADANIGKHKQVELIEKADDPSNPTAGIVIYDKSGKLYLRKKTGAAVEMIDETAQTINGVKTFASTPIIPAAAPTTDADVANKKYVDDQIAAIETIDPATVDATTKSVTFQNGLIMKWGSTSSATTTFPVAFPTACLHLMLTIHYNSSGAPAGQYTYIVSKNAAGFVLAAAASGLSATVSYFAIGY